MSDSKKGFKAPHLWKEKRKVWQKNWNFNWLVIELLSVLGTTLLYLHSRLLKDIFEEWEGLFESDSLVNDLEFFVLKIPHVDGCLAKATPHRLLKERQCLLWNEFTCSLLISRWLETRLTCWDIYGRAPHFVSKMSWHSKEEHKVPLGILNSWPSKNRSNTLSNRSFFKIK